MRLYPLFSCSPRGRPSRPAAHGHGPSWPHTLHPPSFPVFAAQGQVWRDKRGSRDQEHELVTRPSGGHTPTCAHAVLWGPTPLPLPLLPA